MDKHFPDYSGRDDADELLKAELKAAGIPVVQLPHKLSGIPASKVIGVISLQGKAAAAQWQFIRCARHWQCQGPGIPPQYAEKLHASQGQYLGVEGRFGDSPAECLSGFAVGYYEATHPLGLKALAETVRQVLSDAGVKPRPLEISKEQIEAAVGTLVTQWVFPDDGCFSPDAYTMAQADQLRHMLRNRMAELAEHGINPLEQSIAELLPDVTPHEIQVHDPNFD